MEPIEIIVTQADTTPTTSTKSLNQISQNSTKSRIELPNKKNSSTKRSKKRERQPLLTKAYAIDEDNIQTSSSTKYDSDTESKRSLSPSVYSMKKIQLPTTTTTINSQNRYNLPSNECFFIIILLIFPLLFLFFFINHIRDSSFGSPIFFILQNSIRTKYKQILFSFVTFRFVLYCSVMLDSFSLLATHPIHCHLFRLNARMKSKSEKCVSYVGFFFSIIVNLLCFFFVIMLRFPSCVFFIHEPNRNHKICIQERKGKRMKFVFFFLDFNVIIFIFVNIFKPRAGNNGQANELKIIHSPSTAGSSSPISFARPKRYQSMRSLRSG